MTIKIRIIDPILTTHAFGFRQPEHVGMFLFPQVTVTASGGQVLEFSDEDFRLYNTSRAPGENVKDVQFGHAGKKYALISHALNGKVPREHQRDANNVLGINMGQRAVDRVLRILSLEREYNQATLARDPNQYAASNKIALAGTDKFSDQVNSDPLGVIEDGKSAIEEATAVSPNVMVIGHNVYKSLKFHPQIVDKIKHVGLGVVTKEMLQDLFEIERVEVGNARTTDAAGNRVSVWGNDIVMSYSPEKPSGQEEPSFGYTYTMDEDGTIHPLVEESYYNKGKLSYMYPVIYEYSAEITGADAGYLIQNAAD